MADIHDPSYTEKQFEYIHSVGGNAHITAVEIIGELEEDLKSMTERESELDGMQNETQKKLDQLKELCRSVTLQRAFDEYVYAVEAQCDIRYKQERIDNITAVRSGIAELSKESASNENPS